MADKRAFAQFDVGYLDNPKIMDVFDASPIAVCMHFASVLYCAQHLTDGKVAMRTMQRKVGGSEMDSKLLIDAGLWHEPGHDCEFCPEVPTGKVYVHDYTEHNRTSDGVKGRSAAGKKAAHARWEKERSEAEGNAIVVRSASKSDNEQQSDSAQIAMPREKERKREVKELSSKPDEFDRWYSLYPRKEAKENARKAFIKARKSVDFQTLVDGLNRYVASTRGVERKFIALPSSWISAGRWDDEAPEQSQIPANSPWDPSFHRTRVDS